MTNLETNSMAINSEFKEITVAKEEKIERILSVDRLRGFAVFAMIFFQFISHFKNLGFLTRIASHDINNGIVLLPGMTIADIIQPLFMFVVGMTYILSFNKRAEVFGKKATYIHCALRYLALIGLGGLFETINKILNVINGDAIATNIDYVFFALLGIFIICCFTYIIFLIPKIKKHQKIVGKVFLYAIALTGIVTIMISILDFSALRVDLNTPIHGYWITLQAIGLAGLISLLFIRQNVWRRLLWVIGIFIAYTIYHESGNRELINAVVDGGFIGGFGWAVILLTGSVVSEFYHINKNNVYIALGITVAIAIPAFFVFDLSKGSVSPGYILVSIAICTVFFIVFRLFDFLKLKKFDFLSIWGSNPLLMFILEFGLIGGITELLPSSVVEDASVAVAVVFVVTITALLTGIAWVLNWKQKYIRF